MGAKKEMFLPPDEKIIEEYDSAWAAMLRRDIDADEAERYRAMKPFRSFVMKNYSIVKIFGAHVLFRLKGNAEVNRLGGG